MIRVAPQLRNFSRQDLLRMLDDGRVYFNGDTIVPTISGGMPAPPLSNSFEGGTDGVNLTTGNTGGASGDAAFSITDPNSIQKFTTAQSAHGGVCMTIAQTATPASTRWDWQGLGIGSVTDVWFRTYLRIGTVAQIIFIGIRDSAGTLVNEARINSSGIVQIGVGSAGTINTSLNGTVAVSANTWYRFECRCNADTIDGAFEWKLWSSMDSTGTPTDSNSLGGLNNGASIGQVRWGQVTNTTANLQSWHDDVAVSAVTWLGPAGVATAPAVAADYSQFPKPRLRPEYVNS
jgi:hypothetical protein